MMPSLKDADSIETKMQEHLSNRFPKASFPESFQKVQIISLSPTLLGYKITAIDPRAYLQKSLLEFISARASVRGRINTARRMA